MGGLDTKICGLFPGQGSQDWARNEDLLEHEVVRELYNSAEEILGYDLSALSFFEDPKGEFKETLGETFYTQPAVLTHSFACLKLFESLLEKELGEGFKPYALGGNSLGEYTALIAGGAMTFEDGLRLVLERGRAMSNFGEGGLVAVIGSEAKNVEDDANKLGCEKAVENLSDQIVYGGTEKSLDELEKSLFGKMGLMVNRLKTGGAFHTSLMNKAAEVFDEHLRSVEMSKPDVNILSNATGKYHDKEVSSILDNLYEQLTKTVRWRECTQHALRYGANVFLEFGGGLNGGRKPNLAAMTKRNTQRYHKKTNREEKNALYLPCNDVASINKAVNFFKGLSYLSKDLQDDNNSVDYDCFNEKPAIGEQWYKLYIPIENGMVTQNSVEVVSYIGKLRMGEIVRLKGQSIEQNNEDFEDFIPRKFYIYLVGKDEERKGPILEEVTAGSTGAVLHYSGKKIIGVLDTIHGQVTRPKISLHK